MGSTEDPEDGGAVAGAVFGAVFIYIVRILFTSRVVGKQKTDYIPGLLRLLRLPSLPSHARKPSRRDNPLIKSTYPPLNRLSWIYTWVLADLSTGSSPQFSYHIVIVHIANSAGLCIVLGLEVLAFSRLGFL
jgi:hypothetical protein